MKWEPPAFLEINMSAELGGYQSDFSDRDPRDPIGNRQVQADAANDVGSAAVLCAIQNAIGSRSVLRTPVTADRILEALERQGANPGLLKAYA